MLFALLFFFFLSPSAVLGCNSCGLCNDVYGTTDFEVRCRFCTRWGEEKLMLYALFIFYYLSFYTCQGKRRSRPPGTT